MRASHPSIAFLLLALAACSSPSPTPAPVEVGTAREEAKVCAGPSTLEGIDVSEFQGSIDFAKVKASGRAFAITRVSDGLQHHDPDFDANWAGMKAAGMVRGVYQFFEPSEDPVAQADYLLSKIGGKLEPGDLPPVLDFEKSAVYAEPPAAQTVKNALAWLAHIEQKLGVKPIVYTGYYYFTGATVGNPAGFEGYPLWIAAYPKIDVSMIKTVCPLIPDSWKAWAMWQYSDGSASITPGIQPVPGVMNPDGGDRNLFNGTMADLMALASGSPGAGGAGGTGAAGKGGATTAGSGGTSAAGKGGATTAGSGGTSASGGGSPGGGAGISGTSGQSAGGKSAGGAATGLGGSAPAGQGGDASTGGAPPAAVVDAPAPGESGGCSVPTRAPAGSLRALGLGLAALVAARRRRDRTTRLLACSRGEPIRTGSSAAPAAHRAAATSRAAPRRDADLPASTAAPRSRRAGWRVRRLPRSRSGG